MGQFFFTLIGDGIADFSLGDWIALETEFVKISVGLNVTVPPYNGQLNLMNLPRHHMRAGQFCLWDGDEVVLQGFLQFNEQSLGVFATSWDAAQTINAYPLYYCLDQVDLCDEENLPWNRLNWGGYKVLGSSWAVSKRARLEAEYPNASEEQIDTLLNCDAHQIVLDIKPAKQGWMRVCNRVTLENFSDGVRSAILIRDI